MAADIRIEGRKALQSYARARLICTKASLKSDGGATQWPMGVHLTRTGRDAFELSVFRGFSESFWEWLTEQAEEFGYQVI
jgi:hypothetical protein